MATVKQKQPRARNTKNAPVAKRQEFELKNVQPKTLAQEYFFDAYNDGFNVVGKGSAGTGKSYISLALALKDLLANRYKEIIIVRSAVPSREQGFLKGSLEEKESVYKIPYIEIVNDICQNGSAFEILEKKQKIRFITSSYVRGLTFDNAIIIVDEFQSYTQPELFGVISRTGEDSKVIVIGDTRQCDLNSRKEESGFDWFIKLAGKMPDWFEIVDFLPQDIVRSGFVKALILANESY